MSTLVFPGVSAPVLPVVGERSGFPVHRIFCVGRNYAAHAREMGADPNRAPPFFFLKPSASLCLDGTVVPYPPQTRELHHELELVVALGSGGANVAADSARGLIYGYGVGLDLTRRDLQNDAKRHGRPWDLAKGFDHAAPCSALQPATAIGHPERGRISLRVNADERQRGDLADMIWHVPDIIAHLSSYITLTAGDLIYTGTPEGVGPLVPGDQLEGRIDGVGTLSIRIGAPASG